MLCWLPLLLKAGLLVVQSGNIEVAVSLLISQQAEEEVQREEGEEEECRSHHVDPIFSFVWVVESCFC